MLLYQKLVVFLRKMRQSNSRIDEEVRKRFSSQAVSMGGGNGVEEVDGVTAASSMDDLLTNCLQEQQEVQSHGLVGV